MSYSLRNSGTGTTHYTSAGPLIAPTGGQPPVDYPTSASIIRRAAYFDAIREGNETLDAALSHVRADANAGRITPAAAATERCGLLEKHLSECRRLRSLLDKVESLDVPEVGK
jgi:hypothetical protein